MKTCKVKSLSKEHQIKMVSKYSYMISYLNSEDYDIQLAAIQSIYSSKKEDYITITLSRKAAWLYPVDELRSNVFNSSQIVNRNI